MALGDVDGDGDLDLVAGMDNQANRLYLNDGAGDHWDTVSGTNITTDSHYTYAVALGDVVDGDGDLDLVAGNSTQANRLYLNDGTGDPWDTVSGIDITVDNHDTYAVVLGDVGWDGDLDLVAGNYNQTNRLYLNDGGEPWGHRQRDRHHRRTATTHMPWRWEMWMGTVTWTWLRGILLKANRLYLNDGAGIPGHRQRDRHHRGLLHTGRGAGDGGDGGR